MCDEVISRLFKNIHGPLRTKLHYSATPMTVHKQVKDGVSYFAVMAPSVVLSCATYLQTREYVFCQFVMS